jgi:integrase
MGRIAEPWYWAERGGYYAVVKGKRRLLANGPEGRTLKAEARRELVRIQADETEGGAAMSRSPGLHALADLFLARVKRDRRDSTYGWYKHHLDGFAGRVGDIPSRDLRPKHVDRWIAEDGPGWNPSTRRGAITAVKSMTSWAARQGHLDSDPLRSVERPRMGRRAAVPPEAAGAILDSAGDDAFRDLLIALFESGCRPGEVFKVEAGDVDLPGRTWTIDGKTTGTTGKPRVIYLTEKLADVTRKLMVRHPTGPLFRNADGNPWTSNAVRCRFRRRRAKLGKVQAYGLRHLFGTDALTRQGLPPAIVAELMGHSDLKMLSDHYGHVDERTELLIRGVDAIRPPGGSGASTGGTSD